MTGSASEAGRPAGRVTTVLWDIDGTLVRSGGVAARAFLDAVTEVTGVRPSAERRDYGGRIDPEIADMLLAAVEAPTTASPRSSTCSSAWSTSVSTTCALRPAPTRE